MHWNTLHGKGHGFGEVYLIGTFPIWDEKNAPDGVRRVSDVSNISERFRKLDRPPISRSDFGKQLNW